MVLSENVLYIFTDGSVEPNPGPGGWGVLMIWNGYRKVLMGGGKEETNNTMELTAIREGLRARTRVVPTKLFTDSQYSKNSITIWADGWEKRDWLKRDGEPVKNVGLIKSIRKLLDPSIEIHWVKGHAGHDFNEMADWLAGRGRDIYGLGLTEYKGPVDLSPLNGPMKNLKKEGDPPFEEGEEDHPFPVVSFAPVTFEEKSTELAEAALKMAPPVLDVAELLKGVKETRGLIRRAEANLKDLEAKLKELVIEESP